MDVEKYQTRLESRLGELTNRMERIEDALDDPVDPDPEERSVEREDDEALQTLGGSAMAEAKAIGAALDRIAKGTFGVCNVCGTAISEQRLDIVPHAVRCRRCM